MPLSEELQEQIRQLVMAAYLEGRRSVSGRYTLDQLVAGITPDNRHEETDPSRCAELMDYCRRFIAEQQIASDVQIDRVVDHAAGFIEGICKIVGYLPVPEE